jgi:2-oxoglutarate dehydrogenase E2 component (dihydrolipoamide succinyltransferase)
MTTDVVMPQMGESIFEGTITKWLKKAGDKVEKDEPLFEISTDKVDAEIPSPVAGVLAEIKTPAGATVEVNTVVAVISDAVITPAAAPAATTKTVSVPAPTAPAVHSATKAPNAPLPTLKAPPAPPQVAQEIRTSPLVRRMARENNLDLGRIAGTGSGLEGRITKEDVLRHLSERGPGSTAPKEQLAPPQLVPQEPQPLTKMRAIIAQRMVESMQTSPHVHIVYKVDMTRIVRLREREKDGFEKKHGVKLTYMPFIATAAIEALGKYPIVNASLVNGAIQYHQNVDLGIAVALEWGLIVPVVKQAEGRGFAGLARVIADLAARARTKKLLPDEASGSTFTLTNSGIFGEEFGTPIINQPESAILAIGGLRKEPVVMSDAEGHDTIAIRSVQYFCLGFDHRTIDGADAGKFMGAFKRALEGWDREIE